MGAVEGGSSSEAVVGGARQNENWYSVYLLYWCKSTNTDAEGAATENRFFFEVTDTHKKKISASCSPMKIRTVYLLYWYKNTNTDAEGAEKRKQFFSKF
jgi:hypothetical protein